MPATFRQIVDDALGVVGEVAGIGVQQYSDDRMFADAVRGFNTVFKKRFWHPYRIWITLTLDGVLGIATTDDFDQVIDFDDIQSVHRGNESAPLPILPTALNPNVVTGTRARYWSSLPATNANYAGKKIQFWPKASVGTIDVMARIYPLPPPALTFDWEDTIYLDRDMLVYATAFMTLSGDGLNSEAANVAKSMMDMRYRDVTSGLGNHAIAVERGSTIPLDWSVR